eukprot:COSAG02_NODE_3710_length_6342_cov_30.226494_5_plen_102_part_00
MDLHPSLQFCTDNTALRVQHRTSSSKQIALKFARSKCPLLLKFESKDFMSRGADISFLSVYPGEKEALYPPLTFLRPINVEKQEIGGVEVLVATVEPVFTS